jgi:hypothetical protein
MIAVSVVLLSGCAQSDRPDADAIDPDGQGNTGAYLEHVSSTWVGDVPSDEELLEFGEEACEQLAEGEAQDDIEVFDDDDAGGEQAVENTRAVVEAAALSLCPADAD